MVCQVIAPEVEIALVRCFSTDRTGVSMVGAGLIVSQSTQGPGVGGRGPGEAHVPHAVRSAPRHQAGQQPERDPDPAPAPHTASWPPAYTRVAPAVYRGHCARLEALGAMSDPQPAGTPCSWRGPCPVSPDRSARSARRGRSPGARTCPAPCRSNPLRVRAPGRCSTCSTRRGWLGRVGRLGRSSAVWTPLLAPQPDPDDKNSATDKAQQKHAEYLHPRKRHLLTLRMAASAPAACSSSRLRLRSMYDSASNSDSGRSPRSLFRNSRSRWSLISAMQRSQAACRCLMYAGSADWRSMMRASMPSVFIWLVIVPPSGVTRGR